MDYHFKGLQTGEVLSFHALLPVPPHQVVSLTALERQHTPLPDEERLAFFGFDEGEGISRDIQHLDILYHVLEGSAQVKAGEQTHELTSGQCILVPASMPHSIEALSPLRLLQLSVC